MGLSTTDLGTGKAGLPKTISPGNHELKINNLKLEEFKFINGAYHIMLDVETKPIEGFDGFFRNKDDESKGRYEGQIGRLKASQYAFADGQTKSGVKIQRDRSILIFLQNLSNALGVNDWFLEQDGSHETIEAFVKAFNESASYKDKFLEFCVGGKEYMSKSGYVNFDLHLPKAQNGKYAFGEIECGKTLIYDENNTNHLKKLAVKEVDSFGDDSISMNGAVKDEDFSLD
tara:strand:+ start:688 stop:1377 length:690 start_codon:yes stop_codon:yes gene_type:complete